MSQFALCSWKMHEAPAEHVYVMGSLQSSSC